MHNAVAQSPASFVSHVPTESQVLASFRGPPHAYLDVGHSRLAYRRFGQGPDLVFIHGWPLHAGTFRALIPLLADRFTCHLLDLPGAGQTECTPAAPIDSASHATTVGAAIDQLALARYALVAHDSGGAIARLLAAKDARVAALVLGDTEIPGHHPSLIGFLQTVAHIPGGARLVMLAMRMRAVRHSPLGFASCFQELARLDGEFHELFVAPMLRSSALAASQFALLRSLDVQLIDDLAATHRLIHAPTLLLWGEHDPIFPLAKAQAMVGQFAGGAQLEVLAGGKTFVHEEQPDAFVARARPFLGRAFERAAQERPASRSPSLSA